MRKAMIYPFSARCLPLTLYFSKFQPEYSISALVSPVGLGLFGRTPFYAANRTGESDLLVQCEIEVALKQCDALIVPYGDYKNDPSLDVFHDSVGCSILKCTDDFGVQYTFPSQWRCLKPWAVPPGLRLMRYSMAEI